MIDDQRELKEPRRCYGVPINDEGMFMREVFRITEFAVYVK